MKTGIVALTRSEMNSRTTPDVISQEAENAAKILELDTRETLDLGDGKIEDSYENRLIVANLIRRYQPKIVVAPYIQDKHTDHENAGRLLRSSVVLSRLKKLKSEYPPHGPSIFLFYLLQVPTAVAPTLVVDTSDVFERKMEVVRSYRSQFEKTASEQSVIPIGIGDYLFHIESRDRFYGSLVNVKYGEAFVSESPLRISDLFSLIS